MAANLANSKAPKKHKWSLNFTVKSRDEREIPSPPGYNPNISFREAEASQEKENASLHNKRGWEMALGPWKQIPMNLFIMYMAGNSISIFPIMMVGMLFLTPVKAIFSLNSTFKTIEGNQATLQKLVYLLGNCAVISLALYKCQSMGLLPTHASDWLDFVEQPKRIEFSGGGIALF